MDCPKCIADGRGEKRMTVTHSYKAGPHGRTERLVCLDVTCGLVATAVHLLTQENPPYGAGAGVLARKMTDGTTKVAIIAAALRS